MSRSYTMCMNLTVIMVGLLIIPAASADSGDMSNPNLYRVSVLSPEDARILAKLNIDPLLRVREGYLVLSAKNVADDLVSSGLDWQLIATDVDRRRLALDISHGPEARADFPIIFEESGTRIYLVDSPDYITSSEGMHLAPIRTQNIPIRFKSPPVFDKSAPVRSATLDSLINGIAEDSLIAYTERLQAYNGRDAGTSGSYASAFWAEEKFIDYGCDSVVIDTFTEKIDGVPRLCRNVVAYKIGTDYPYHHLIIGAHRDAAPSSPGADDNGSGTAAVLEIARAMAAIETKTTIVFILFDAEEYGLLGSWNYAGKAYGRYEKIAFMLNMDMIAHYENTNEAHLYYEFRDSAYARIWADLADSIPVVDLIGHLSGWHPGSDHIPFSEYGYPALFVHEYILSPYLHTPHDSTVYLNYDYFTRMTKACAAFAYTTDQQFVPDYDIQIDPLTGYPTFIPPNTSTPLSVAVHTFGGASIVPGSIKLHYSLNDGETQTVPMTPAGNDVYDAILPPLSCLDNITYHISVEEDSLGKFYSPRSGVAVRAFSATDVTFLLDDNFGSDLGWTVTGDADNGHWKSTDWFGAGRFGAPDNDFDGNDSCCVTGETSGTDVDRGSTILTSPLIQITANSCRLEYARWYSNDYGGLSDGEVLNIDISTDGGFTWLPIDSAGPVEQASGGWYFVSLMLEEFISLPADVYLRFTARDLYNDSQIEAAVDAVKFVAFQDDIVIITESIPTWTAGHQMIYQLQANVCEGGVAWEDKYNQLDGTGLTLQPDGLLTGISSDVGTKLFTARATDDYGAVAEKRYIFYTNPALTISTGSIPAAALSEPYSVPLSSSGGTGDKSWVDRDGDLIGSGVTLGSDGNLSGTPVEDGDISFVARVTDQVGATAEKTFTLHVVGPYVCGDASGDSAVNVADAVWIINYVFSGGPAPSPIEAGDANADGGVTVSDAVYIINYVFKGGPEPECL